MTSDKPICLKKKSWLKYAVDICVNWLLNTHCTPPHIEIKVKPKVESKPNTLAPHMPIFIVNQDLFQYKQKITFCYFTTEMNVLWSKKRNDDYPTWKYRKDDKQAFLFLSFFCIFLKSKPCCILFTIQ